MKRIFTLCLMAGLLLSLAGCAAAPEEAPDPGLTFHYGDISITPHQEAAPILEALGAYMGYTEEASCAFEGLDKTYYYGSFYLSTYTLDGTDYVYRLWFADDGVATPEGIRIGSQQTEVEAAYGPDSFIGGNTYVLTRGDTKLTILITDGTVTSVKYEALVK